VSCSIRLRSAIADFEMPATSQQGFSCAACIRATGAVDLLCTFTDGVACASTVGSERLSTTMTAGKRGRFFGHNRPPVLQRRSLLIFTRNQKRLESGGTTQVHIAPYSTWCAKLFEKQFRAIRSTNAMR